MTLQRMEQVEKSDKIKKLEKVEETNPEGRGKEMDQEGISAQCTKHALQRSRTRGHAASSASWPTGPGQTFWTGGSGSVSPFFPDE